MGHARVLYCLIKVNVLLNLLCAFGNVVGCFMHWIRCMHLHMHMQCKHSRSRTEKVGIKFLFYFKKSPKLNTIYYTA